MTASRVGGPGATDARGGLAEGGGDLAQMRWLLGWARPVRGLLVTSVVARLAGLLVGATLLALPAWVLGSLASDLPAGPGVVGTVVIVALLALVRAGLRYVEQLLGHLAAFRLLADLRLWLLDRLIPQAPALTEQVGGARVMTTAQRDVDRVEVFFAHTIVPVVASVLVLPLAVLAGGLLAGPAVAGTLALVLLVGLLVPLIGATVGRNAAGAVADVRADVAQEVADGIRCREEIAVLGARAGWLARLGTLDGRLAGALRRSGLRAGVRHCVSTARVWGGTIAVLAAGLASGGGADERLPGLLAAVVLVAGTAGAFDSLERFAASLPAGLEATRRVRALAAGTPAVPDAAVADGEGEPGREPTGEPTGAVLTDASHTYPGRGDAGVSEVSLDIPPGAVVGVCGVTGSGKSTLKRLLQRHLDADAGAVQVGGVGVADQPLGQLWQRVVVADADPFLLTGSLRENLLLGAPGADEAAIVDALRRSGFAEVVERLPDGLDAPVAQRGASLSGGERQRLALARALLRAGDDALLVLDEATSQLDAPRQAAIVEGLRGRRGGTLLIAHRLEVLRRADEIVVLEAGRVVERGTWAALASADGPFAALLAAAPGR